MIKSQSQPREVYLDKNAKRLSRTMENPTCPNSDIEEVHTKVALCCCQQSKQYPMCDGTHEHFNKQTNSNVQPIIVEVDSNGLVINRKKKKSSRRNSLVDSTDLPSQGVPTETQSDSRSGSIINNEENNKKEDPQPSETQSNKDLPKKGNLKLL